jgi:aryl-alcohol dehydrogenase-like predicted oxidoreductase
MKTRLLRDIEVSAVGMGCMGFHHGYGPAPDREEAVRLIRYAVELGCTHFDTAEGYGRGHNELLVGEALRPVRDQVVIAMKLRVNQGTSDNPIEKQVREHLEASLRRLGMDQLELYYLHRINPAVPVEDVAHPMGKLIREEKFAVGANHNSPPTKFAGRMA